MNCKLQGHKTFGLWLVFFTRAHRGRQTHVLSLSTSHSAPLSLSLYLSLALFIYVSLSISPTRFLSVSFSIHPSASLLHSVRMCSTSQGFGHTFPLTSMRKYLQPCDWYCAWVYISPLQPACLPLRFLCVWLCPSLSWGQSRGRRTQFHPGCVPIYPGGRAEGHCLSSTLAVSLFILGAEKRETDSVPPWLSLFIMGAEQRETDWLSVSAKINSLTHGTMLSDD